jgi:hypothetical protein
VERFVDIPAINDYATQDIRGVMQWVAHWVDFESDGGDLSIAPPWETYETQRGNCEDITILAMYLLKRDLGIDSGMAVFLFAQGFHTMVEVGDDLWEPQVGLRVSNVPLFVIAYDDAMALAGVR